MQQRESSYLEPSQSTSMPGKPVVDQPGEPRLNRIKDSVQSDLLLYHRLKLFSSNEYFYRFLYVVRSRNVQPFCNHFRSLGRDNRLI